MNNLRECNYILRFNFLLLLFFFSFLLEGQIAQFSFNKITVQDNLTSQIGNYYVFQDSENMIWISSIYGLNRFDGTRVSSFLLDKNIQSNFFEDQENRLWFGTDESLICYQRKTAQFEKKYIFDASHQKIKSTYQPIYFDTLSNYLWLRLGTNHQLYKYHIYTHEYIPLDHNLSTIECTISKKENNTHLLIETLGKGIELTYFSDSAKSSFSDTILNEYTVSSFYEKKDTLWASIGNSLIHYDLKEKKRINSNDLKISNTSSINNIIDAGENLLIISTFDSRMFYVEKKSLKIIAQFSSYDEDKIQDLPHPIEHIYLDKSKNLWISIDGGGIAYTNLNKPKIHRYFSTSDANPDSDNSIKAIAENSNGQLFCLTNKSIKIFDEEKNKATSFSHLGGIPKNITSLYIHVDKNDNLWYCSNYGLFVKKQTQDFFEEVTTNLNNTKEAYTYLYETKDSTLLVSSYSSGLYEVKEKSGTFYLDKSYKVEKTKGAFTILFENSNAKIIAHHNNSNLYIYQNKNNHHHLLDSLPFSKTINGIVEDTHREKLWLATDIGLYQLIELQDSFFLKKDDFFPKNIITKGLLLDSLNNLWISSNNGLFFYTPHTNKDSIVLRNYSTLDGLQSLEFNFWSAKKLTNGKFAFGGVKGINVFDPYKIKSLNIKPNPTITRIEINNELFPTYLEDQITKAKNVTQINKIILNYNQNDLRIEVSPLEYSNPQRVQYFFQMVGNGDTIIKTTNNIFDYPNIQPGHYTLTYNASNSDGIWFNEKAKQLEITINPPWWKTKGAYFYYFLIFISIVYLYYRYRISQIRKEEAFKRKEVEFLQKEAEYKQLVAETETAVLRLQMNPHFIFNSMNSISSYILQKDINTANDYLLRFAKLMRMILNFAAKPLITITEEMELLEQYLKTEEMRFEKKFKYTFHLTTDLDPDEYLIPTMILQPFIENAIWHGISNKKDGNGQIAINFWKTHNSLHCAIEDNGVGRSVAASLNQQSKSHQSQALSITHHRIQMITPKNGISASFNVEDLWNDSQNPIGTKVIFQFPIL